MKFAIVTPSYHVDFDRCRILCDSIDKHIPSEVVHYILVTHDDYALFSGLKSTRREIVLQEDVIHITMNRIPWAPHWRYHWRTLPIRGWIFQQLVKLSVSEACDAEALMVVDSDCLFFRPFDPRTLIDDEGRVPLFREQKDFYLTNSDTQKWHRHAARILGLPKRASLYDTGYVSSHVFWRRDILVALRRYLGAETSLGWISRISFCPTFSEYVLYGMFMENIIGFNNAGHYVLRTKLVEDYWPEIPMTRNAVAAFYAGLEDHKIMVHINGKSRTPPENIRQVFGLT